MRLAIAQVPPLDGDPPANLRRLDQLARRAHDCSAELLVLPEMFLTGYVLGRQRILELAGSYHREVAEMATRYHLAIAYGYPERNGATVFNTVGVLDQAGTRLLDQRKIHYFGQLDADQFDPPPRRPPQVVSWRGWQIGVAICYDIEFPETARALAVAGADLIVVPTANMIDYDQVQHLLLPARALENQVYLAYANYCGSDTQHEYGGLSRVLAPTGEVVATATRDPTILVVEIDRDRLTACRQRHSYLADRRFDITLR